MHNWNEKAKEIAYEENDLKLVSFAFLHKWMIKVFSGLMLTSYLMNLNAIMFSYFYRYVACSISTHIISNK